MSVSDVNPSEADGKITVTLECVPGTLALCQETEVTIDYQPNGTNPATFTSDYTGPTTVTIPAPDPPTANAMTSFDITFVQDPDDEPAERFNVSIASVSPAETAIAPPGYAIIEISDDDEPPTPPEEPLMLNATADGESIVASCTGSGGWTGASNVTTSDDDYAETTTPGASFCQGFANATTFNGLIAGLHYRIDQVLLVLEGNVTNGDAGDEFRLTVQSGSEASVTANLLPMTGGAYQEGNYSLDLTTAWPWSAEAINDTFVRITASPVESQAGRTWLLDRLRLDINSNMSPVVTGLPNHLVLTEENTTWQRSFSIVDDETPETGLSLQCRSGNTSLIPNDADHIKCTGTGSNRNIELTPAVNRSGTGTIHINTTDGEGFWYNHTITVTVTPVPDDPVFEVAIPDQVVPEDGFTGNLSFKVEDGDDGQNETLIVTATSSNEGTITDAGIHIEGTGPERTLNATLVPNATTPTTITLTVEDVGGATDTTAFLVTVAAINDAPVVQAPADASVSEDGSVTFHDAVINVTDVDAGSGLKVRIIGIHGALSLNNSQGAIMFLDGDGVNDADMNFTGSPSNINLRLDGLTFTPTPDHEGAAGIQIIADDQGNGPSGALQGDATIDIAVTPVNDAPHLNTAVAFALTTIDEDDINSDGNTTQEILDPGTSDGVQDIDVGAEQGVAINATAGNGTWQFSLDGGTTWSDVEPVSATAARLIGAGHRIRYVPDGNNAETASFTFRAWDNTTGNAGGTADATQTGGTHAFSNDWSSATIAVTGVNDAPNLTDLDQVLAPIDESTSDGAGAPSGTSCIPAASRTLTTPPRKASP